MKTTYSKPISNIEEFKSLDVVTTSTTIDDTQNGDNDVIFGE